MLPETLSPAWCETLLFDRVLLEGTPEQLRQDPPLIIINLYSHSSMVAPAFLFCAKIELPRHSGFGLTSPVSLLQGGPKPLGRAFTEPEFKTVDQLYKKSHLRFYDVNLGKIRAGELLASFELIELDYSFGEVKPFCPIVGYRCVTALTSGFDSRVGTKMSYDTFRNTSFPFLLKDSSLQGLKCPETITINQMFMNML